MIEWPVVSYALACALACQTADEQPTQDADLPVLRAFATAPAPADSAQARDSGSEDVVVHDGESFTILRPAIITESHVARVAPSPAQPQALDVWLDDRGTELLARFTSQPHVLQSRVAFRFGDRWVSMPSIQAPIRNGRFVLLNLTEDEMAAAMAAFGGADR